MSAARVSFPAKSTLTILVRALILLTCLRVDGCLATSELVQILEKKTTLFCMRKCRAQNFGKWVRSIRACKKLPYLPWPSRIMLLVVRRRTLQTRLIGSWLKSLRNSLQTGKSSTSKSIKQVCTASSSAPTPSFMRTLQMTRFKK